MNENPGCCRKGSRLRITGFSLIELITVMAIISILVALLLPAIQAAREAARRSNCRNQLRQLGIGLQIYHTSEGHFPPGVTANGDDFRRGMHSGFAYLLPFLEERELERVYSFRSPWNHLRNSEITGIEFPLVSCPSAGGQVPQDGGISAATTDYAFCKGPLAYLCPSLAGGGIFDINSQVRTTDILDGASKTFAMGEAASGPSINATST